MSPLGIIMRGLDPRIHQKDFSGRWIAGSSPAATIIRVKIDAG
jgi:hypothetical protein